MTSSPSASRKPSPTRPASVRSFSLDSSPFPKLIRPNLEQSTVDPSRPTTLLSSPSALTSCVSFPPSLFFASPLSRHSHESHPFTPRAVLTFHPFSGRCPRRWCLSQALFRRGAPPPSLLLPHAVLTSCFPPPLSSTQIIRHAESSYKSKSAKL